MSVVRILIVDDLLPWQHLVRRILEPQANFKIIDTANDGLEAVQKTTQFQPDVVLIDIGLPGISGFEAARQIRLLSPASRILFVTEWRGPDFIQAGFEAGGLGYVLKSDVNSDLLAGIRAILRGQQFVSQSLKGEIDFPD
jgi:two-component system, NarL family, response regulator NreC